MHLKLQIQLWYCCPLKIKMEFQKITIIVAWLKFDSLSRVKYDESEVYFICSRPKRHSPLAEIIIKKASQSICSVTVARVLVTCDASRNSVRMRRFRMIVKKCWCIICWKKGSRPQSDAKKCPQNAKKTKKKQRRSRPNHRAIWRTPLLSLFCSQLPRLFNSTLSPLFLQ